MFLCLPAEIRNMIYSDLLISADQPIRLMPSGPDNAKPTTMLGVCKQVRDEAVPIFYRRNQFELDDPESLYRFLHGLSIPRRRQIAHVTLARWGKESRCATAAFRKLAQCIRLTYLKISLPSAGEKMHEFIGIKAFAALRGLQEVLLVDADGTKFGSDFVERTRKRLLQPRSPCKRCERAGRPV